jgi:hypothetical protein
MKKTVFIFILFSLLFPQSCSADGLKLPKWSIAQEISRISYKEPGVMKQTGTMSGLVAQYTYLEQIMLQIEGRLAYGQVDYVSVKTGNMDNIDDILFEFRALMGVDLSWDKDYIIVPYAGYGYRYLEDDSEGRVTTTGFLGYKREANYYYAPIGLMLYANVGHGFVLGTCLEYDHFWQGIQKSYLSGANSGYNDLENKQKHGYGYRFSINIKKQMELLDIMIEPYFRYWRIEESDTSELTFPGLIVDPRVEPKNYSKEYGLRVAVFF